MARLSRAARRGGTVDPSDETFAYLHIIAGCLVLVFAVWRVALRLTYGAPSAPTSEPAIFRLLASLAHVAIYALIFILPVSGLVAWIFGVGGAASAHVIAKTVLLPLIFLHVAGALVHHFFWKTDVLRRMLVPALS